MAKLLYMVIATKEMKLKQLGAMSTITSKQYLENPDEIVDTLPVGSVTSYRDFSDKQLTLLGQNLELELKGKAYSAKIELIRNKIRELYKTWPKNKSYEFYESELKRLRRR